MKRCQPWLGTYVTIRAEGANDASVAAALGAAFAVIKQVHRIMSFHDAASDLSRLNRSAHLNAVQVHAWTYQVLELGLRLYEATGTLFDCAVAPSLIAWGHLPHCADWGRRTGSMRDIRLLPDRWVTFNRALTLDLGGIAKGFAVDRAMDVLMHAGVCQAVVNAGGDLRVHGPASESVHVRHPRDPNALLLLGRIANGAIATSAAYFISGANPATATVLVDPRTATPVVQTSSYSVIAPTCAIADALTKPLAIENDLQAPYFKAFGAQGVLI